MEGAHLPAPWGSRDCNFTVGGWSGAEGEWDPLVMLGRRWSKPLSGGACPGLPSHRCAADDAVPCYTVPATKGTALSPDVAGGWTLSAASAEVGAGAPGADRLHAPGREGTRLAAAGQHPQLHGPAAPQGDNQAVVRGWLQGAGGIFWRGRAAGKHSRPNKRGVSTWDERAGCCACLPRRCRSASNSFGRLETARELVRGGVGPAPRAESLDTGKSWFPWGCPSQS